MSDEHPTIDEAALARAVEAAFPEALGVWLYGSFADGPARADSDVDVAVLAARRIDATDRFERAMDAGEHLGRTLDLVDLRAVPPALRFEVFRRGRRIAARDPLACDRFETTAVSQYQRLNVERREIFEAIATRGSVY
jgi:predicted nucleotidyltransferase